ncbi:Stage 0 sporulation protein YaaT [Clostridiaceae bacterium JG1575]|nr:Stage 0 sporulation protein YaaT [Clostridiaceae bacterium JG1575]
MVTIVGIRFKRAGKIYFFDPQDLELNLDDAVLLETARGVELGIVALAPRVMEDEKVRSPLKPVLRVATEEDMQRHLRNLDQEAEAFDLGKERIAASGLPMKLVDVEITFDRSKIIFYFTADGRVDFRELVKDLASVFKMRIELRQIGVRDEARMMSGIGPCGRTLCCSSWLADFAAVSIKMAKEQNLSLNPTKISGMCGRLMCCLKYEQENYEIVRRKLPRQGSLVKTPEGSGEVVANSVIREELKVRINREGEDVLETFALADCELIKGSYEDHAKTPKSGEGDPKEPRENRERRDRKPKDGRREDSFAPRTASEASREQRDASPAAKAQKGSACQAPAPDQSPETSAAEKASARPKSSEPQERRAAKAAPAKQGAPFKGQPLAHPSLALEKRKSLGNAPEDVPEPPKSAPAKPKLPRTPRESVPLDLSLEKRAGHPSGSEEANR